jgi:UPF0716 protein FxsA
MSMRRTLSILLFAVISIEIILFLVLSHLIGGLLTTFLVFFSAILGLFVVKQKIRNVWYYVKKDWSMGILPTQSLVDGICVIIAGLLFMFPGILTDLIGMSIFIPVFRKGYKVLLWTYLQQKIAKRTRL